MFVLLYPAGSVMPGADSICEALAVQQRGEGQVPQPSGHGSPLHIGQPAGTSDSFIPASIRFLNNSND